MNILVVDDNYDNADTLKVYLELVGHTASVSRTGTESLMELQKEDARYDGMVLDQRLPDSTGLDILKEMRQMACLLPVIIITAMNVIEIDKISSCIQSLQPASVMRKPFMPEELVSELNKLRLETLSSQPYGG